MNHVLADADSETYHDIAAGLEFAKRSYFINAANHFISARNRIGMTQTPLITALDAYLASHTAYWEAEQELHNAGVRFATAYGEQQMQLTAIQRIFSTLAWPDERQLSLKPEMTFPMKAIDNNHQMPAPDQTSGLPALSVRCFGRFVVRRGGEELRLCTIRNGQAILRYLIAQPGFRANSDDIMEVFWPEDSPAVARHKLHVAISALRAALNHSLPCPKRGGYLVCDGGLYMLNPTVVIHTDVAAFIAAYHAGRQRDKPQAIEHYQSACRLYAGPFLSEDRYSDWSMIQREQLTQMYLTMCDVLSTHALESLQYEDAIHWAGQILNENRCDESAYRCLIRAYAASGRRTEAIRQYQRCERVLMDELSITPDSETIELFSTLIRNETNT